MKIQCEFKWCFCDDYDYYLRDVPGYFLLFCCGQLGLPCDDYSKQLSVVAPRFSLFEPVCLEIDANDDATIKMIIEPYISCVGFSCTDFFEMGFRPSILTLNECIDAEYSVKIKDILRKYECGDTLRIVFFLSVLQGEVFKAEGYSFYMYSNERTSHNLPHVHVYRAGECPLTIDFLNLNIIEGEISGRKRRRIMKIISDKQELLIKHWNEKTNGITINVDYTLKYY